MADKRLNSIIVLLNNGEPLKIPVNYFERLNKASQSEINSWELFGGGTGLRWKDLDEDLSPAPASVPLVVTMLSSQRL